MSCSARRHIITALGVLCLGAMAARLHAQPQAAPAFEHISTAQGLSVPFITSLWQDRRGFLWIGTTDGLNRYDGYDYIVYRQDPADPNTLSDNYINTNALYEDQNGWLWIGTRNNGLSLLDPATDQFTQFKHNAEDSLSLSHNNVLTIHQSRTGVVWVGTQQGLNRYDPERGY